MKKVVVGILSVVVLAMGYLVYNVLCDNQRLKSRISYRSDLILKNENDKLEFETKQKELEVIKENNKEKASKYDEVNSWNQEIVNYLD